jgi:IstB-like ATP binding protein
LKTSIVITTNRGVGAWCDILGDTTVAAAMLDRLSGEDPDGVVVRFDGDAELYAFEWVELKVLKPGAAVRVVAKGDEHYADIGTVYAVPDEDDVILDFGDVSGRYAFRHYELKVIGTAEIPNSSSKIAAIMMTRSNDHQNPQLQRFRGQCGVPISAPGAAPDGVRRTSANAHQAQPSPAYAQPQQPIQDYAEFQRNVPPAWPRQSATGGEPGFRGFWLGLTDSAR